MKWSLLEMAWACTWKAWTLIMIFWHLLEMAWGLHMEGLNLAYGLLVFAWNGLALHLEGMHLVSFWPLMLLMRIHLWWAQVLGLEWFKKQVWASIPSRVQSYAFGLEFIHSIQGSNNHDGLKRWTWVIMVQTTAKQMHNAMQFTWTNLRVGSMGHYNMGRR